MFDRISDYLNLYQFSNGSILFCLHDMKAKADAQGDDDLSKHIQAAIDKNLEARKKNFSWTNQKKAKVTSRRTAADRDPQIDRTLGQIYKIVQAFAAMEGDTPQKKAAKTVHKNLFQQGVRPIILQTFEEEHARVTEMVSRFRGEFSSQVDAIGATPIVNTLDKLNTAFGKELDVTGRETLTFDQVDAARSAGEDAFYRVVMRILGKYIDDEATRNELMASVFDQNERIASYIKRRGKSPQVDSGIGEVVGHDANSDTAPTDAATADPAAGDSTSSPQPATAADA